MQTQFAATSEFTAGRETL